MRLSSRTALAAAAVACATALAACGTGTSGADDDEISVVASTNVWGSIAQAVAGDRVEVRSLITEPNADPHSYEASPLDAAAISDASLVVYNGGGYDHFVDDILGATGDKPAVVEAFALFESGAYSDLHAGHDHGDEDGTDAATESTSETTVSEEHSHESDEASDADVAGDGHSHEGHDHGGINEHVWYDLATADAVAHAVAEQLSELDPDGTAVYEANAAAFHENLHYVADVVDKLADTHGGAPIAQTETIGHYLVSAATLDDVTPPDFTNAIENGTDPSPAAIAATRQLLVDKQVRALIYNPQTEDRISREMRTAAESSGVPVVEVFETLPDGVDYIQWQARTAETLAAALETAS
ncbi:MULTISPECIES: metal ABC transporter solute-binding protein, Zn/Mn family [Rhodococcus]|uniref:Zinc/manganese transport system substrate-binding protein n=1 Tax=Rhodococcus rhodochrous J45 TaxID=935266 RepID=A0A562DJ86_RHORH|nr:MULTISPECIES: zinc ABC transporter substrate-binding protein [Rhodococcus]OWY80017.1 ABC transporter permease [Rhodococcus sp. BUPNP1]TWH09720.1 zinc/manganese transport system substrate-binding protein [Rhodococcus rhodochrous J45]